jgi:hypothetical protein
MHSFVIKLFAMGDFMRIKLISIFLVLAATLVGCGGGVDSMPAAKVSSVKAAAAIAPIAVDPQNGWWWNPAEGGSGYAIERQGNQLFMSAFLYEMNGRATWYVSTLTRQVNGTFTGSLLRYSGGQSLLGAYKPATETATPTNVVLTFNTSVSGTLLIQPTDANAPRLVSIERFPISSPAFSVSNGAFESGWWWNEAEGGRGFFIEVQGSTAFIGSFMYDNIGQPIWYASTASLQGTQYLSGALLQYSNGQSLTGTYKPAAPLGGTIGNMAFNFTSADTANMVLPNGVVVPLKRFIFNPTRAEGVFEGVASNGRYVNSLVLENDQYYVLYGSVATGVFNVYGFVQGDGKSKNGNFTSTNLRDFYSNGIVATGSLQATYDPNVSFNASVTEGATAVTFAGSPLKNSLYNYDVSANFTNIIGSWSLTDLSGSVVSFNIASNGTFVAASKGCFANGTIKPRSSGKNVFDVAFTFGAAPCPLAGQSATGIALEYPLINGKRQLIVVGTTISRANGTAFLGVR